MKIVDESILFFSRVSLSKFSLEALYISLATWPRDWSSDVCSSDLKHKDNTRCVIEEEIEAHGVKPLCRPPSGKQSTKECSWDT